METGTSSPYIRESLDHLTKLLGESSADCESGWLAKMNQYLGRLEQALLDEAVESRAAQFFKETAQAHPRLLWLCTQFHEEGRRLLLQAGGVIALSVRSYESGTAPLRELRKQTALLMDAVKRHQDLESKLLGEAVRDLGGEG